MIHPERRRENLKKIEEMDKHDAEWLQPDWKTWCMNKKVDMVEVVRCKDCKHSEPWYGDKSRCFLWHETGIDVFNDGFCNYGERKEGR